MLKQALSAAPIDARAMFESFAEHLLPAETPPDVRDCLISTGHPLTPTRGQVAFLDPADDQIVYIVAGATKLVARFKDDREQIVAFHFRRDLISLPAHYTHPYALVALQPSQLLAFPAREFLECSAKHPPLQKLILERIMTALHRARDKSVGLGRKSAEERMASFLITMAERIGRRENGHWPIDLPMSRRDIADALGLTIETVSRQLGRMRDDGLIETSGRSGVTLLDPTEIERRAGHCRPVGQLF